MARSTPIHPSGPVAPTQTLDDQRLTPGILAFTPEMDLLLMNYEAQELCARLTRTVAAKRAIGLLPPEVIELGQKISALLQTQTDSKDWEQLRLRCVAGDPERPVLVSGFGLPSSAGIHEGRILILLEEMSGPPAVAGPGVTDQFHLTNQERAISMYLFKGFTNKEIACSLGLSEQTVKKHFKHIMLKTHTKTRTGVLSQIFFATASQSLKEPAREVSGNGSRASRQPARA